MAQRVFGPVLGAGVRVEEVTADRPLEEAPLGVTCYLGIFERGKTGTLLSTYSKKGIDKLVGGRIPESLAPDAALDFWQHSQGAGELHCVRVTDGTEVAAALTLYSRRTPRQPAIKVSAASGGEWGGATQTKFGHFASATALVLTTGATMKVNEFAGGTLFLDGVTTKSYQVRSNDGSGNVTVAAGSNMLADLGASGDLGYTLEIPRDTSNELAISVGDGESDSVNEWSLQVFLDGALVKRFPNLSSDPASPDYFVHIINDDPDNNWIVVADLSAGGSTPVPADRPSGFFTNTTSVAPTEFGIALLDKVVTVSPTNANPVATVGTTTDAMDAPVKLVVHMTSATAFNVYAMPSDADGANYASQGTNLGAGVVGTLFVPTSPQLPPFTLAQGSTIVAVGDRFDLLYTPLEPNALVGGLIYPDPVNYPMRGFRISGNDHSTISVSSGDLTKPGGPLTSALTSGGPFIIVAPMGLMGGQEGLAGITDQNYIDMLDPATSPFNNLLVENKGLVKIAVPGITSTAVQQAALAYAEQKNWQCRVEFPDTIVTEDVALAFINQTIGRSDMGKCHLPSYGDVNNPDKPGTLKRTTLTGMIHGREALVAKNFLGYHKAAAGVEEMYQLPNVISLPATGLDEEVLNPAGINVVKRNKGRFIMWGDRTISVDPTWKFAHQRELMSHYENELREGFDFIVFGINDPIAQGQVITSLREFFLPEFQKRAIRGATLDDAAVIKVDSDVNTDSTRAAGDLVAELQLRLADTIERFIIRVGKAGIFESVGA